jgi:putative ABC transport system permease protein
MSATWTPLPPLPPRSRLRLWSVLTLYGTRLRTRWVQELLAVVGIAIGVALLYAGAVATSSLSGPVKQLNRSIIGDAQLQLVARGPDGFSDARLREIQKIPGVELAAPVLQAPASVRGPGGARKAVTVYATDPRIVHLRGSLTQGFSGNDLVQQEAFAIGTASADALRLHTGDLAHVDIAGRPHTVGIVVLGRRDVGALSRTSIATAPIAYLEKLTGLRGQLSRVLIRVEPGRVGAVRAAVGRIAGPGADVRDAGYEPKLFNKSAQPIAQSTTIASTLSSLVGFMFAMCALLVTVPARRALAVDLRRSGFTNGQIGTVLLMDAAVLAVAAVVLGLVLGELLSRHGFNADASFLEGSFPIGDERVVTWTSYAIAIGGGVLATVLGVLAPVRGELLARGEHRGAPGGRATTPANLAAWTGLALMVVAVVVTLFVPSAAVVGLIALTAAIPLLTPAALRVVLLVVGRLARSTSRAIMPLELALPPLETPRWRVRSLAIAATGALAVFGSAALHGARENLKAGLVGSAYAYDHAAAIWVSPYAPGDLFSVAAIPPGDTAARLQAVPGVAAVRPYRGGFLDVAGNRAWVRAPAAGTPRPVPAAQILEGSAAQADARFAAGGWATLSRALAHKLRVGVGDPFTLPTPNPTRMRVAAITTNLGLPGGAVLLNASDYARAWGSDDVSAFQVTLRPGTDPDRARAAVQRAVGGSGSLRVETTQARDRREVDASRSALDRLRQVGTLTLIAAVIAMAAAMAGLLWQQRPGIARQKLDGHSTTQMWAALAIESGLLFVTGCLLGALAALWGQLLFSRGLQSISGFPVEVDVRIGVAATAFGIVAGTAVVVVALPGYLVARVPPSLRPRD